MFGPSPIKPIEKHMQKAYQCAKELQPFFQAVMQDNWDEVLSIRDKINQLEKEADVIKRELRLNLPTGLFLPVARTDILELLSAQDRIANKTQDIAGLIVGRKMKIPGSISPLFFPFLDHCLDAARQACKATNELDELLESGFRGSEVKIVDAMIVTLDKIEHESDDQLYEIRQKIFELEKTLPPLDIIFLYKLVQWIGDIADHSQTVGARLQILIAR